MKPELLTMINEDSRSEWRGCIPVQGSKKRDIHVDHWTTIWQLAEESTDVHSIVTDDGPTWPRGQLAAKLANRIDINRD